MLSFFRNFSKSRLGLIAVFFIFALIVLAFAAGDITGLSSQGAGAGGNNKVLVKIGKQTITDKDLRDRIDTLIRNYRREGQNITMEQVLAQGGVEEVLKQLENSAALVEFAKQNGMFASKALIDGEISSIPAFQGVDGKFNQKAFDSLLAEQRISPKDLRDEFEVQKYSAWLINPTVVTRQAATSQVSNGLVEPYASVLLQRRMGTYGIVRTANIDRGAAPDDKALAAYYNSNKAKYMVPARRVIRYATVKFADVKAASAATDSEIAEAYAKSGARFAATEKRTVRQLVLADQTTAAKVAADVKAGKSIADQARALGLSAGNFEGQEKAALAKSTSPQIADAAFAAAQGGVVGPVRTPLGWAVLHVEKVEKVAAKSLDQVKGDLATEVTARKTVAALIARRQAIEDAIGSGSNFDEIVKQTKLTTLKTVPLAADGTNPDDPKLVPDPALIPVIRAGFAAEPNDDPQVAALDNEGSFALVAPERVIASAARPLDSIKAQVIEDYLTNQSVVKARALASEVIKKINGGMSVEAAMAGIQNPTIEKFAIKLSEVNPQTASPAVRMAFTMPAKKAKFLQSKDGFIIVYLDQIEEHSAAGDANLMTQMRNGIGPQLGQEHAQQFLEAVKKVVKIERNDAAIAAFKAALARDGAR
jgi:peptidyl-prolyl cis-trans isomerase D